MEKNTKRYEVDGISMQFDTNSFEEIFRKTQKNQHLKVREYELQLANLLNYSNSAIHNWRMGENGPADIHIIQKLADCLKLTNYKLLLKESEISSVMEITERQKDSLKRIYDSVVEYLHVFQRTGGFNDYWIEICDKGVNSKNIESKLYDLAEQEHNKVILAFSKEYIVIKNLELYNKLDEYVYDDLVEIYNNKLSYGYRFEAQVENVDGTRTSVTTEEDYVQALKTINEFLDPYV